MLVRGDNDKRHNTPNAAATPLPFPSVCASLATTMATATAEAAATTTTATTKCFTPLQSRPFWAPVMEPTVALCPSMDLITLRVGGDTSSGSTPTTPAANATANNHNSSPLWLHRSLDFYQLSIVGAATAAVWRADGRWLAVVEKDDDNNNDDNNNNNHSHHPYEITLYHVEAMVEQGAALPATAQQNLQPTAAHTVWQWQASAVGHMIQFPVPAAVLDLQWAHCVCPTAGASLYERTRRALTTDTAARVPPSAYHLETDPALPPHVAQPMSVLTVWTTAGTLDCFWLGLYPVLRNVKIRGMTQQPETAVVRTSLDISHWWIYHKTGNASSSSTLCSLPALAKHRYTLQSLAILYHAIQTHLNKLPTRLAEMTAAYASSLKPLDLKWEALQKLLHNYGLLVDSAAVPKLLAQYILLGHAACTADLSNAMDQFFTSMPMNEYVRVYRKNVVVFGNCFYSILLLSLFFPCSQIYIAF